jgi:hypothetical protein
MTQFNITNSQVEQLTDSGNNYKLVSDSGNNAISAKGNVVQVAGDENKVQVDHKKEGFWSMLWKKIKSWWK